MLLEILSSATQAVSGIFDAILAYLLCPCHWYALNATIACTAIWALALIRWLCTSRRRLCATQLQGPLADSVLYGVDKRISAAKDSGAMYEAWAKEYGPIYAVPSTLGGERIILCDPKTIAYFYSMDTWAYMQTPFSRMTSLNFSREGLSWPYRENHKRQRKYLAPTFSIPAVRRFTSIFYDAAYKVKGAWDVVIQLSNENGTIIDVQNWMNRMSLDIVGLAGLSHDFGALEGKHMDIIGVFDAFSTTSPSTALDDGLALLELVFPILARVPTSRARLLQRLNASMEEILNVLSTRIQKELDMGVCEDKEETSIIGLLMKGASSNSESHLTKGEVMAQMEELILWGYETTAISLTWALLELSRNLDVQTKLRNELIEHGADPTYDELANGLPYLDAVVHEIFRIHPPSKEFTCIAIEDDIIPLSEPIRTRSGKLVDSLTIAKDTPISISVECMNRSGAIWGNDAKLFQPDRWLVDAHGRSGIPDEEIHRHLLTFMDGLKICLGKSFAMTEFKVVLAVLIKNYVFELWDGPDSKIGIGHGLLQRPRMAGEDGCKIPLRVQPYVAQGRDHEML